MAYKFANALTHQHGIFYVLSLEVFESPKGLLLRDWTQIRLEDCCLLLSDHSQVEDFRMELGCKDAAVFGDQTLDAAAGTFAQEIEPFRHCHNMVRVIFRDINLIPRQFEEGIQKRMTSNSLPAHFHPLNQSTLIPLLNLHSKTIGHKLMSKTNRLNLQTLTLLISSLKVLHRLLHTAMFLIHRPRTARQYNNIKSLNFLDGRNFINWQLGYLIEEPLFVVIEFTEDVGGIVVLEFVDGAGCV